MVLRGSAHEEHVLVEPAALSATKRARGEPQHGSPLSRIWSRL